MVDLTGRPEWMRRYKVQAKVNFPVRTIARVPFPPDPPTPHSPTSPTPPHSQPLPLPTQVPWDKYKKTLKVVTFNLLILSPLFALATHPLVVLRGNPCGYDLPSPLSALLQLTAAAAIQDVWFYYTHR